MDIGLFIFATDYTIRVDELAKAAEDRGYESLWFPEHTHIPASRKSPFPGGGELPLEYSHTHDLFVTMAYAAAATSKLVLGSGICLVPQHNHFNVAKAVASLDMLSGGRIVFGIGGGWNVEEMNDHGAEYKTRFKQMRESVLAMKALWTEEEAEFHGEMIDFDPAWSHPKPVQKPHPPIVLGGETDYTLRRVVEFCDGWLPRGVGFDPDDGMARLRRIADEAGRDMSTISIGVFGAPPDKATLDTYAEKGVTRALLKLPSADRDTVLGLLDEHMGLLS
jgi:probable F420-dependent oxidoreductase